MAQPVVDTPPAASLNDASWLVGASQGTAWEEQADFVEFRLVAKETDALHFSGISFYRRGDNNIDGFIVMRSDSGIREHPLTCERRE